MSARNPRQLPSIPNQSHPGVVQLLAQLRHPHRVAEVEDMVPVKAQGSVVAVSRTEERTDSARVCTRRAESLRESVSQRLGCAIAKSLPSREQQRMIIRVRGKLKQVDISVSLRWPQKIGRVRPRTRGDAAATVFQIYIQMVRSPGHRIDIAHPQQVVRDGSDVAGIHHRRFAALMLQAKAEVVSGGRALAANHRSHRARWRSKPLAPSITVPLRELAIF